MLQLDRREKTEAELQSQFLSDSVNGSYAGYVMNIIRAQKAELQLRQELLEELGLDLEQLQEFVQSQLQ